MLERYLEDLEARLDPDVEEDLLRQWRKFTFEGWGDGIFSPRRTKKALPGLEWPRVPINETLQKQEAMALQQLGMCSTALAEGRGALLCVRANYGTGILPSVFGASLFVMPPELDTLPTTRPLEGGTRALEALLAQGPPDIYTGLGARVFEMGERFVEWLAPYPKLRRYVYVYHPDLQGPMDVCELLLGSNLFLTLVDRPSLMHDLLNLVTETYSRFMRRWIEIAQTPASAGCAIHWQMMHRGTIMLRDDSAMNLSPEMFREFIAPYDQKLLDEFGGGAVHFCGRGSHFIGPLSQMSGVYAVAMSQPEYNDMETIFSYTVDQGIRLLALHRGAAESALQGGRSLRGLVHCW
ncbi:MAG: uroporphyrinogen decarboxylase family protein [Kiritimatiellae bacterium]|nr:uroporphyrinogen decarboxylase family protein [Kiritimatiellia bacterium]